MEHLERPRHEKKEDLRLAGVTTNIIANMGNLSMDTLIRICKALDCDLEDVIELSHD